ncbi:MAG TPA: alpha-L-arabinofuranosidase C-terminal domain-containing protein [Verrucomicrobiae bacterium]|jgi:alpha-N-arabinofuranosidase
MHRFISHVSVSAGLALVCAGTNFLHAQPAPAPVLRIDAGKVTAMASPALFGLMTEEINYSYEGGLYGELIRNRSFKSSATEPKFWTAAGGAAITLDTGTPLNGALNLSLKVDASQASPAAPAGVANAGYWGIPARPRTKYRASFYARAAEGFHGPITAAILGPDGKTALAKAGISGLTTEWKKYEVTLKTKNAQPSKDNTFAITTTVPGTIWLQQVSLFPPTFHDRPNGNRPDIMELLGGLNPKFLRFPGGNYLEGNTIETRFNWKNAIGDPARRPGHRDDGWGYWSTDGLGLLEFLDWCEDLKMQPVLAIYAGYSMRQQHVEPGPDLQPYVQDGLDEIEYVTGDASTTWGARRAKDGHPAPFPLRYVEIGNEDFFDRSRSYDGRFAQFYDAIKAKYPSLQIIATDRIHSRAPDLQDEHYYRSQEQMESHAHDYDKYSRTNHTKIFCGEWATRVGSPTPNMAGALGDAAWMTGMERNSDLVVMSCYAPLFVNVSPGAMQWKTDLIGYDALNSYGSPAYYAQKMFSTHHGDEILDTSSENIPAFHWQPPANRRRNGADSQPPPAEDVPALFFDATRDSHNGLIYLKIVNSRGEAQPVRIALSGVSKIAAKGKSTTLKAASPDDTNSINDPKKIIPVTETIEGLAADFTRTFPAYSITVLEIKTGN